MTSWRSSVDEKNASNSLVLVAIENDMLSCSSWASQEVLLSLAEYVIGFQATDCCDDDEEK